MIKIALLALTLAIAFTECPKDADGRYDYVVKLDSFKGDGFPCMYSGLMDSQDGYNMFYWMFRHDEKKPLVLWMNGGPGYSSIGGMFLENGPL